MLGIAKLSKIELIGRDTVGQFVERSFYVVLESWHTPNFHQFELRMILKRVVDPSDPVASNTGLTIRVSLGTGTNRPGECVKHFFLVFKVNASNEQDVFM
jgi:hypothetical protein